MMAVDKVKSALGCFVLVAMLVIGVGVVLARELFLDDTEDLTGAERRAEQIIDGPTPDVIQAAVEPLREDHTYVDPMLTPVAVKGMLDGSVSQRIDEIGEPIYVAQLPSAPDDGSADDQAIAVEQLADAVDRDGVYIVLDDNDDALVETTTRGNYPGLLTGTNLEDTLDGVDGTFAQYRDDRDAYSQITNGLYLGAAVALVVAGLVYALWRLLRERGSTVGGFE